MSFKPLLLDNLRYDQNKKLAAIKAATYAIIKEEFALVQFYSYFFSSNALYTFLKNQYTKPRYLHNHALKIIATPIASMTRLLTLHESAVGPHLLN